MRKILCFIEMGQYEIGMESVGITFYLILEQYLENDPNNSEGLYLKG